MSDGPRNWKWMVPGVLIPVFLSIFLLMISSSGTGSLGKWVRIGSLIPLAITWILLLAAISNYRLYFRQAEVDIFSQRRQAEILSSTVEMARAFNGLHPSYAKILTMHMNTVWEIKEGQTAEGLKIVDYILYGTRVPVHVDFIIHVLKNSSAYSVMPERMISDGSTIFDPVGTVTDREQYQELVAYWRGQGRVTNAHGNQPAQWIYPWDPELVARAMDIEMNPEEAEDAKK